MAPELRKRKVVAEAPKSNGVAKTKAAEKATPKGKRKAADDSSPVSLKKQKSTKKTAVEKKAPKPEESKPKEAKAKETKPKETKAKKTKPEETKPKKDDDIIEVEEEEASDAEGQDDENLQVLAVEVDPEEEDATNKEEFQPGQDVGKIPKVSKGVQKSIKASKEEPGVVYIGRIPHGFYEHEMKQYLSQFGPISRLRLSRNRKTGASKHFAFVEFAEASTAEIVAKTMDNYLLFGHILKCKIIAKEQLHEDLFKGANKRFNPVPWNKMAGKRLEKPLTESAWETKVSRERSSRAKKAAKLKDIGYEFEAPKLKDVPAPPVIENGDSDAKAVEAAPEAAPETAKDEEKTAEDASGKETAVEVAAAEPEAEAEEKTASATKKKASKAKATKSAKSKKTKA